MKNPTTPNPSLSKGGEFLGVFLCCLLEGGLKVGVQGSPGVNGPYELKNTLKFNDNL